MKLLCGDCLEIMKYIPDESIDMVLTSPPYDDLRTYGNISNWNFDIFKLIANEIYRVIKWGGAIVWIVNDATINGSETGTSFKQALFFKSIGFNIHDTMIWEKQTFTDTGSLKTRYGNVFEYMFVFSKGKLSTFNPIKDRENLTKYRKKHGTVRQKDGSLKQISNIGKQIGEYGQRFNVWKINTVVSLNERCGHPAQFPIKLAEDHIVSWSKPNDLVLDPFMGSGTTGVACVKNKRNFIGIEINKEYYNIARNRIENEINMR